MQGADRVILLTGPGAAAIAVMRLAGRGVGRFLSKHFSRPARVGRCVHGELADGDRVLDDPVVVLIDEMTADVNVHGGAWVVRSVIELAEREGFELTPSGEETLQGVDGESPLERQAMASLPQARTELAVRALLSQPCAWEAAIPRGIGPDEIQQIAADRSLWWLLHPPRVAIIGVPNVGKSTLANQLFAQERSIVADLPGTTRDWVGELANIDGLAVMLVDTPGLRSSDDVIEQVAIQRSGQEIQRADLVLLVLDATHDLRPQRSLIEQYPGALIVVNKVDRPAAWGASSLLNQEALHTVATTGVGIDELRRRIVRHFGCEAMDLTRPRWWTQRQREDLLLYRWPVRP